MDGFTMPPTAPVAFNGLVAFAWIGVFLLIGMMLRASFPVFRRYLIPACIIGGVAGFILQNVNFMDSLGFGLDTSIVQNIVYHLFNLTWVYVGLRAPEKGTSTSATMRFSLWAFGLYFIVINCTMAFSMASTTILGSIGLNTGPDTIGFLTAYGFTYGPGQTLTIANIWAAATSYTGLPDFALAGGAMGFAIAIIVGICLMNIIARKKKIDILTCPSEEEGCGFYDECTPTESSGQQTTSATSIDVLAWHIAIGLFAYLLAFMIAVVIYVILPPSLKILVWSIFFLFGAIVAMGVRIVLTKFGKGHLLCNNMNNRVSNTLVDFLVCATFASIQVGNVTQYLWPYIVSCLVCTISVASITWFYCSKMKEDGPETFAFLFGNMTGTISTAFILLRLLDPQGKSQVPVRMALANFILFVPSIPLALVYHLEVLYGRSPWEAIGILFGVGICGAIVAKIFRIPMNKKAWQADE